MCRTAAVLLLTVMLAVGGCARPTAPPGAQRPEQPQAKAQPPTASPQTGAQPPQPGTLPGAPPGSPLEQVCTAQAQLTPALQDAALARITAAVQVHPGDPDAIARDLYAGKYADPRAIFGDVDGDGRPDTLITFGYCQVPPVIYLASAPDRPVLAPIKELTSWSAGGGSRIDRVADVNGDGRPEVVIDAQVAGASAAHTFLYILQWQGDRFATLFTDHLTNWVGPTQWTVGDGTVSVQCHPMGPFEFKMMEHRLQTETFRWDPKTSSYILATRTIEPPPSQRLQAGAAEALFQQGKYAEAIPLYQAIAGRPPKDQEPDWIAFGHLRIGQIHALAGRKAEALAELDQAARGREPIATLAGAFRQAYDQQDAAAGFTALWKTLGPMAYSKEGYIKETWPIGLDPDTVGARRAMLEAYQKAGRTPPDGLLPKEIELQEPDCLKQDWG